MSEFKCPGYTPMTDDDFEKIDIDTGMESLGDTPYPRHHYERRIEQAVLARIKPDAEPVAVSPEVEARVDAAVKSGRINDKRDAERDALVARIDDELDPPCFLENFQSELLRDIRAYLVGGGK